MNQGRRDLSGAYFESSTEAPRGHVQYHLELGHQFQYRFQSRNRHSRFRLVAAGQFAVSEVNGTVVIAIPSNHQTYTLQHTTLSQLHLSNIVAKDSSAIDAWQSALASAPVAPAPVPAPPPPAPPPPAAPSASGPTTWSASSVYTAGMTVTENGVIYKANWWTQGADPAHNNGGLGTGQPWTIVASTNPSPAPSPAPPPPPAPSVAPPPSSDTTWSASSIYTAGMTATENGVTYKANWWTQGADPAHNNGGTGTGQPWTIVATASAPPPAPAPSTTPPSPPAPPAPSTGASASREFTPYIDMAMPQDANLSAISAASGILNFRLAFVLSSPSGIGWQGAGTISDDALANGTTILSQVKAIQAAGGDVTISFGGAAGQEAALTAMTAANLQAGYQSVIDRYHVHSLDFDIEAPRSRISAPSRCAIRRWWGSKPRTPG